MVYPHKQVNSFLSLRYAQRITIRSTPATGQSVKWFFKSIKVLSEIKQVFSHLFGRLWWIFPPIDTEKNERPAAGLKLMKDITCPRIRHHFLKYEVILHQLRALLSHVIKYINVGFFQYRCALIKLKVVAVYKVRLTDLMN